MPHHHLSTMDRAIRDPAVHWPGGYWPDSGDVFLHDEITVAAPAAIVWRHLVTTPRWPEWYPDAANVRILDGRADELRADTVFELDTFGIRLRATIGEFIPDSRLGWFGAGDGIRAYHTWLISGTPGGCHVVTEEVANGPTALSLSEPGPEPAEHGHDPWLQALKRSCER
jgi:hypothetical protein